MMFIGTLVRRRMFGNVCDSGQKEKDAGINTKGDKLCFSKDTASHNIVISP